jgi:hypothetical protein
VHGSAGPLAWRFYLAQQENQLHERFISRQRASSLPQLEMPFQTTRADQQ